MTAQEEARKLVIALGHEPNRNGNFFGVKIFKNGSVWFTRFDSKGYEPPDVLKMTLVGLREEAKYKEVS